MSLEPAAIHGLSALFLGFAFAGLVASAFEMFTQRRASFTLLQAGGALALASVPVVVFAAPFIIIRNTVRGRQIEGRPMQFVVLAGLVASLWSLACGQVVLSFAIGLFGLPV